MDGCSQDEIAAAIAAHGSWKRELADAVRHGRCEVSASQAADAGSCALGRWLDGSGASLAGTAEYAAVRAAHVELHRLAAEVIELAVAGRVFEARVAMSASSRFAGASAALTLALVRWQNEAA
jgi:hypothetical protein